MKTMDYVLLGGGALLILPSLLKTTGTNPAGSLTTSNAPAAPAVFSTAYYLQYQYPAMLAANPNIGNPSYTLTPAEANQYLSNYLDIAQWAGTVVPKQFPTTQAAAQYHWKTYGVAEKRTFLPLIPQDRSTYTPAQSNGNTSGGGDWVGEALQIAGTVAAFFGTTDLLLNNKEAEVVITGSAVAMGILPFYYNQPGSLALNIDDRLNTIVKQYTA